MYVVHRLLFDGTYYGKNKWLCPQCKVAFLSTHLKELPPIRSEWSDVHHAHECTKWGRQH